jgi:hypothetical protein
MRHDAAALLKKKKKLFFKKPTAPQPRLPLRERVAVREGDLLPLTLVKAVSLADTARKRVRDAVTLPPEEECLCASPQRSPTKSLASSR